MADREASAMVLGLPYRVYGLAVIDHAPQPSEQRRITRHREACNLVRHRTPGDWARGWIRAIYRPRAAIYR